MAHNYNGNIRALFYFTPEEWEAIKKILKEKYQIDPWEKSVNQAAKDLFIKYVEADLKK